MSGVYNGVQSWILDACPKAHFIPCAAHSLNLVGVNAAERVVEAKLSLGQIQNLFLFFHGSTSRWQVLNSKLHLNLQGQRNTRWSSRADSVNALSLQYWNVAEVLIDITTSTTFNSDTIAAADSLLKTILTFKFLLSVKIWDQVLYQINLCNLTLQKDTQNIYTASKKLAALVSWLKEYRVGGFQKWVAEAKIIAEEYGIEVNSGFEDKRRTRGVKRTRIAEQAVDESRNMTTFQKYEANFFNELMDNLISEMNNRFEKLKACVNDFQFLWGKMLANGDDSYLQNGVNNLCVKYQGDFDENGFCNEVKNLKHQMALLISEGLPLRSTNPIDILNALYQNHIQSCFPNVSAALQIFLTLPVTVASNERSFSKLKIVKNYLRSRMGQERLTNLSILSIEQERLDDISFDEMISTFANSKCRRAPLK